MNGFDDTKATTRLAVLTGLCGLALGCNLVVPMFFRDVDYQSLRLYPWYCSGGALVAEICLLGIWCGLSLQAIKYRLPVTLSLLLVVVCSYWVGLQLPDEDIPSVIAALVAAGAFGMFAILQLPLWVMRYCSPRRITLGNTELHGNRVRGSQFSVRYLMLWTTLTGLLLVTVRHSLPTARTGISGPEVVSIPLVMFAYAGFSTAFCLPWIWILLGEKHSLLGGVGAGCSPDSWALLDVLCRAGRHSADPRDAACSPYLLLRVGPDRHDGRRGVRLAVVGLSVHVRRCWSACNSGGRRRPRPG